MHTSASPRRRRLLLGAGVMVSLGAAARTAAAESATALHAHTFAEALEALGPAPMPSAQITLDVPDIAENGAAVPITVSSTLPGTREIVLLVDGSPQPVAATFSFPVGTEAFVATRIRMVGSGTVYAVARTEVGLVAASRAVEVLIGGCG
jgi:sulfur-oxidizing protein SoxY